MMLFNLISNIMKKIFVLMVLCTLSMSISAQEVDSLQSNPISIDSLAVKLVKLQHDYDFLKCEFELRQDTNEIGIITNEIQISANFLLNECYHRKFNIDLYKVHRDKRNEYVRYLNALKENIKIKETSVALRIISSNFTNKEIELLKSLSNMPSQRVLVLEGALRQYEIVLDIYKNLE